MHQFQQDTARMDTDVCVLCRGPLLDKNHYYGPTRSQMANERQVGGRHYESMIQHWDYVWANNLDYFQGQITKYVTRWRNKNGLADLEKAQHFLEKYIELVSRNTSEGTEPASRGYVDQDR